MKRWLIPLAWLLAGTAHAQDNCEALRAQIEGRIREAGVTQVALTVLEADQQTSGRIVGTCAMGKKKIAYVQADGAAPAAAPRPSVLTECRDGSTPVDGRCKN